VSPRAKSEESRRRILDAARAIFFEQGFEAANLDSVARVAGVAKGTIYRYFESKAELYVAVLAHNAELFVQRMEQTIDPALDPEEQIRRIARFYFRHYTENPEYFRIFWAVENERLIGGLPEGVLAAVTGVWERCLAILSRQIERGIQEGVFRRADPWTMANIFWIVGNGMLGTDAHPELKKLRGTSLEALFEEGMELVIRGLKIESQEARQGPSGPPGRAR
jgi:AcrR family transcriptional regulator